MLEKTKDYGWVFGTKRVRIGYVTYKRWQECPCSMRGWYFICRNYPSIGVWQFTILGFQFGFRYRLTINT